MTPSRNGAEELPCDAQAEAAALGCCLWADLAAARALPYDPGALLDQLDLEHFHDQRHKTIFRALLRLQADRQPLYPVTLHQSLCDTNSLDAAGGLEYVAGLPDQTPGPELFPVHLERLQDRRLRRVTILQAIRLRTLALDEAIPRESLTSLTQTILESHAARNGNALTLREPHAILQCRFDDSDLILGDRLLAAGQSLVIAAQGGAGKSRFGLQLAAAVVAGRPFLGIPTYGRHRRWLILQTENSNRRLYDDLSRLKAWLGADWNAFSSQVLIHTIEHDQDGFVSLDSAENTSALRQAIHHARPDVIMIDPLGDFAIGDLNKDADMRATLSALSRVWRQGNPQRGCVVLQHALTGKGGALKAVGYDRSSFARNSKVLLAWARAEINLAPVDADSNSRLVVACGKCNNGREFAPFGVKLADDMIYEVDPSVDVEQWAQDMTGDKGGPLMTVDRVRDLCEPLTPKQTLVRAICEDSGCSKASAYRFIARATKRGKIAWSKNSEAYSRT